MIDGSHMHDTVEKSVHGEGNSVCGYDGHTIPRRMVCMEEETRAIIGDGQIHDACLWWGAKLYYAELEKSSIHTKSGVTATYL